MRMAPQRPQAKSGIHEPKGAKRWAEWERQKKQGMQNVPGGDAVLAAAPTSTAESRLLPAGRAKILHVGKFGKSPKLKQTRVPHRENENPVLLAYPKPGDKPYKTPSLSTRVGVYGTEQLPKEPKTVLHNPRYDPINHKYDGNIMAAAKASPMYHREGSRRLDGRIVPGNLSKKAPYSHHRDATGNILNNHVSAEAEIAGLRLNSWKFEKNAINARRDACMSSRLVQEVLDRGAPVNNEAAHGIVARGLGGRKDINDTAVSNDGPDWMIDQARRANPAGGVHNLGFGPSKEGFQSRIEMEFGTVSDNAVSADGPNWMVEATRRIDPDTVLHRSKKPEGVRSTFFDDRGNQISDATVSADAPKFLTDANRRIDEANLVMPQENRIPWHNRKVQQATGPHPSEQTETTSDFPARPTRKIDYPNAAGHANSMDAPQFMVSTGVRARNMAKEKGITITQKVGRRDRPNWCNRIVMGGDRGRIPLLSQKDGVDEYVAGYTMADVKVSADGKQKSGNTRPARTASRDSRSKQDLEDGWNSGSKGYGKGFP